MIFKCLFVGDPHATPDSLDDCENLLGLTETVAREHRPEQIVLLGDLYHTHAVMRVEVLNFWLDALRRLVDVSGWGVKVLKGNHDGPVNDDYGPHALLAHESQESVEVVDTPREEMGILYMPYFYDSRAFLKRVHQYPDTKTLVCHQTFLGAKYENNTPIYDGININDVPQELIISGHIHSPQKVDKLWYVGAPRWRTAADANVKRAIWLVTFDDGKMVDAQEFDTGQVCSRIIALEDRETDPIRGWVGDAKDRLLVDIYGSTKFIRERKGLYPNARVRTFKTEEKTIRVRESEGIGKALQSFTDQFEPQHGTERQVLAGMVKDRIHGL